MSETDIAAKIFEWAVAGAGLFLAWCITHFVGRPILDAYRARERFVAIDLETSNISPELEDDRERARKAMEELRGLAGKLKGIAEGPYRLARWFLRRRSFDVATAVPPIIGYSNSILSKDGVRAIMRYRAERALGLTTTDSLEDIQQIERTRQKRGLA
jgi:hypothetical protein